jgi:hypothetical protein
MKRLAIVLAAASAAVVALATGVVSTGGAQQPSPPTGTLQFVQRDRDVTFKLIDIPPRQGERRPPTPGDGFLIRGGFRDQAGNRVGHLQATFVITDAKREEAQVSGTFILSDGHIVVAGAETKANPDFFAITGGTGRYAGARGTLQVTESRRETAFLLTFAG